MIVVRSAVRPRLKEWGALSAWPGWCSTPTSSAVRTPKGRTTNKVMVQNRT
jgi:hypothetical protein